MASQGGRLSSRWGWLLLMTSSTASALSLANVQPIIPATVSLSCILAYYAIIPDCTVDDFVRGDACSAACVAGLKRIQNNIREACSGADIPSDSVLGQEFDGGTHHRHGQAHLNKHASAHFHYGSFHVNELDHVNADRGVRHTHFQHLINRYFFNNHYNSRRIYCPNE
ncbi:uncharacterized protein B0T15DRAFT_514334 [Chaetomium strumarium]|uniref:Extracellular membrane protein CFEM domain-containing protein n=1 Tax=Chaetomium strumarium TaxID=1170767 RepID=A0AAJ0GM97_9PEZI|nr:hypothetical protein B0T15DRAFT_514334 [Chaetomium strumarium]